MPARRWVQTGALLLLADLLPLPFLQAVAQLIALLPLVAGIVGLVAMAMHRHVSLWLSQDLSSALSDAKRMDVYGTLPTLGLSLAALLWLRL